MVLMATDKSAEKNSGNSSNHVSRQLQLLEEEKNNVFNGREDRGFTFSQLKPKEEKKVMHRNVQSIGELPNTEREGLLIQQKTIVKKEVPSPLLVGQQHLDNISSIDGGATDYNYQTKQAQDISPLIQQEVTAQINLGLRQFFEKLDQKLQEQQKQSRPHLQNSASQLSMAEMYDLHQQDLRSAQSRKNIQAFRIDHQEFLEGNQHVNMLNQKLPQQWSIMQPEVNDYLSSRSNASKRSRTYRIMEDNNIVSKATSIIEDEVGDPENNNDYN